MAFFVLSGYIIAYTADQKDRDLRTFVINRVARLYSVCVPAILITIVADHIGFAADPALYSWHDSALTPALTIGANLLFLNQIWTFDIPLFSNIPYWSLGYEAPYYAIFACMFFLRGWPRLILTISACLIAGPKILELFPIWLMGAGIYFGMRNRSISRSVGWVVFAGSLAALVPYEAAHASTWIAHHISFAVSCYAPGILIMTNIIGATAISRDLGPIMRWNAGWIKKLAGNTFSIYLYHFPLLLCFAALVHDRSKTANVTVTCAALGACFLLGSVSEKRKNVVRKAIERLLGIASTVYLASRAAARAE